MRIKLPPPNLMVSHPRPVATLDSGTTCFETPPCLYFEALFWMTLSENTDKYLKRWETPQLIYGKLYEILDKLDLYKCCMIFHWQQ